MPSFMEDEDYKKHCCDPLWKCSTNCLQSFVKVFCGSSSRWLDAMGYGQVLEVRNFTHMVLWSSAFVALSFAMFWCVDVVTMECFGRQNRGCWMCVFEGIGVFIFFAGFRDSVQMIAHFDDSNQKVLKEKRKIMEELQLDSSQVLETAKSNVDGLRGQVVEQLQGKMTSYCKEVFTVIFPKLVQVLQAPPLPGGATFDEKVQVVCTLAEILRANLEEVSVLAAVMYADVLADHAELCRQLPGPDDVVGALLLWDAWVQESFPQLDKDSNQSNTVQLNFNLIPKSPSLNKGSSVGAVLSEALHQKLPVNWRMGTGGGEPSSSDASNSHRTDNLSAVLGFQALQPVDDLLNLPARLERWQNTILGKADSTIRAKKRRFGCGRAPWRGGCTCCIPHACSVSGHVVSCLCCGADCCPCQSGATYPKRGSFFCLFWFQIHSRLQERLLLGLLWALTYISLYGTVVIQDWSYYQEMCASSAKKHTKPSGIFEYDCLAGVIRHVVSLLMMVAYIPCILVCLWNVERLDKVLETIETIWQLEDVNKAVSKFNRQMVEIDDQIYLLQAIGDRVFARADMVMNFGRRAAKATPQTLSSTAGQFLAEAQALIDLIEAANKIMKAPDEWMRMPLYVRQEVKEELEAMLEAKRVECHLRQRCFIPHRNSREAGPSDRTGRKKVKFAAVPETSIELGSFVNGSFANRSACTSSAEGSFEEMPTTSFLA